MSNPQAPVQLECIEMSTPIHSTPASRQEGIPYDRPQLKLQGKWQAVHLITSIVGDPG
ncbi:hypothetical protein GCM10008938_26490 [Deinococcus roseus]|uniref:Uncharacterized protein n=2 Tax=Deinococcus roseus TaxID=392414 RepID=A0ABQ2D0M2_9DEIO|nr:hypothetical protein GCM10008938_26490 [Deinococcus roseus]